MSKARIGMIGAGVHATNMLYPSLEHLADLVERVAVCDLVESKAATAARNYGFERTHTDYRRMLEDERLDGVIVCLNAKPSCTRRSRSTASSAALTCWWRSRSPSRSRKPAGLKRPLES